MKRTLIALACAAALAGCTQIDTGNVGVESTLGQVKTEMLPPGVYMTLFKRVLEVSAKELPLSLNDLRPQTSDKITLADLDVDVYVQLNPSRAVEVVTRWPGDTVRVPDGYGVGLNYVQRQAREVVYNVVSKHGSATVHTERNALSAEIVLQLQKDLDESAGKGWFFVRSANIRSLVTDVALENQIKLAAQEQFKMQQKENELKTARVEADRKRIEAQGDADSIRIRASAISVQGGKDYVELQAIAKWNGVLPSTTGVGALPFVNVGK